MGDHPAVTQLNREQHTVPGISRDLPARAVPSHTLSFDPYFRMSKEEAGIDYNSLNPFQPATAWEELEDFEVLTPVRDTRRPTTEWGEACEPPPLPTYDDEDARPPSPSRTVGRASRGRKYPTTRPITDTELPAGVVILEENL